MLVFWKARLVLLAVPKTGTTALEEALLPHADAAILNPPQQKHCTVRRYRNQLQKFFEQRGQRHLELMAVVREPVGWLESWYRYRARDQIRGTANSTADISFDAFVEAWLQDDPPAFARVGRQSRFVSEEDGALGVDHLFRHDRLEEAVRFVEGRIKAQLDLGYSNVSPARDVHLSDAMEQRLRSEAPEEFALWSQVVAARP
ncbi:gamma-glutamyl kinase [Hasllibacter sp. MH4015]|uniref:gamma-glutamyl kinase n=1 Tax=Hasllibacter sp. MH4015 TaxID=2854029 RepID=UPI001CD8046A|nr:gamma-glutamyl kinase [Hasllibacter sp. MH4015]